MENYCATHEICFGSSEEYNYHVKNECADMLKVQNICTHHIGDGRCCRRFFNHSSSLILHYKKKHKLYACVKCYSVYKNTADLEKHSHTNGLNLRESNNQFIYCLFLKILFLFFFLSFSFSLFRSNTV